MTRKKAKGETTDKALSIEQINLRTLRRAKDMTQDALDDEVGVPRGRTSSYEKGVAQPPDDFLRAAAKVLKIKDVRMFRQSLEEVLPESVENSEPVEVPYWGVVPCGDWDAPTHDPDKAPVAGAFRGRSDIVAVRATGESMMPLYKPGQIVPIRLTTRKSDGVIVLIRNEDNELSLKVSRRTPSGTWEFHSINPLYEKISSESITLLGVAVHVPEVLDLEGVRL